MAMRSSFALVSALVYVAAPAFAATSTVDLDGIPPQARVRPQFGIELAGSAMGLGASATGADVSATRGFLLQAEYQPAFVQAIGVISLGVTAGAYPSIPATGVPAYSLGAEARYQAVFFRSQILVPFGGYA